MFAQTDSSSSEADKSFTPYALADGLTAQEARIGHVLRDLVATYSRPARDVPGYGSIEATDDEAPEMDGSVAKTAFPMEHLGSIMAEPVSTAMWEYGIDAWQRSVLFWDVIRQRSNQYKEHVAEQAPHVLQFEFGLIMDGRTLPRPVNYALVKIEPAEAGELHPKKRPFVIVDPRAGHGPGIGGFKAESEIGVAIRAGHPCYFIGFLPEPVPGQTIEDVTTAVVTFIKRVSELHPEADAKPAVIGNCQAGWQVAMAASVASDHFGPLILAGAPMSYWAGVRGKNPMRYTGGMTGGSWLATMMSDLGAGHFDGAWLVSNFENLNPANTLWTKQYNLFSKIDTEAPRYLGFERWWGGHVTLNGEEIQYIVDNLFVGNKLSSAELVTKDNIRIDLRSISSPILIFCSHGDDITPPQQALSWILDLYGSVDDIRSSGQTILYTVHDTIGHLGIFVSGKIARKEHKEFAHNIDFIDVMPPGLYEIVITPHREDMPGTHLIEGNFVMSIERRTLDDIRALGVNSEEDERAFATVSRVSDINLGLYRTFMQPWVKAMGGEHMAKMMRTLHPARLPYESLSDANPVMKSIGEMAEKIRVERKPSDMDNPFLKAQAEISAQMISALNAYRDHRDQFTEQLFFAIYGSPWLQALVGLKADDKLPRARPGIEPEHLAHVEREIERLRAHMTEGGTAAASMRMVMYVNSVRQSADERGFAVVQRAWQQYASDMSLGYFKQLVRDQFLMLILDQELAVKTIPELFKGHGDRAPRVFEFVKQAVTAVGELPQEGQRRLDELKAMTDEIANGSTGNGTSANMAGANGQPADQPTA